MDFSDVDVVSVRSWKCLIAASTKEVPFRFGRVFYEQNYHLIANQVLYRLMDVDFLGLLSLGLFLVLGRLCGLPLYLLSRFLGHVAEDEVGRLSIFEPLAGL